MKTYNQISFFFLLTGLFLWISITSCDKRIFAFVENDKLGYKNRYGKVVIPAIYKECVFTDLDSPCYYEYGKDEYVPLIDTTNKYGILDAKGRILLPFIYDDLSDEFDSTFIIQNIRSQEYHLINIYGDTILKRNFSSQFFIDSEKIFSGEIDGINIVYDPKNDQIIDTVDFYDLSIFINGLAEVSSNNGSKKGLIDYSNNLILDTLYLEIHQSYKDSSIVVKDENQLFYVIDSNGDRLTEGFERFVPYYNDAGRYKILGNGSVDFILKDLKIVDSLIGVDYRFIEKNFIKFKKSEQSDTTFLYRIDDKSIVYVNDSDFDFQLGYILKYKGGISKIYEVKNIQGSFDLELIGEFRGKSDGFYGYFPFLSFVKSGIGRVYTWRNKRMQPLFEFEVNGYFYN